MLTVERVSKSFGSGKGGHDRVVLQDISLIVESGEFVVVIGPSGCGKSTLLNCIAGFELCTTGSIDIDGKIVDGPQPGRAVVFQHASLFPWRTVAKNVSYGLEMGRLLTSKEMPGRVQEAIDIVGLTGCESLYPHQISGGMQQRVNLARALATKPSMLLMDEPFGALDAMTKETLQDQLVQIVQGTDDSTVVFITHDISEAVYLADRVVVMAAEPGRILDVRSVPFGRPRDRSITESSDFVELVHELRAELHTQRVVSRDLVPSKLSRHEPNGIPNESCRESSFPESSRDSDPTVTRQ